MNRSDGHPLLVTLEVSLVDRELESVLALFGETSLEGELVVDNLALLASDLLLQELKRVR
jgi:hypothetical protein